MIGAIEVYLAEQINTIDNPFKYVTIVHIFNYETWRNNQWQR
jgi:hypothetical protein